MLMDSLSLSVFSSLIFVHLSLHKCPPSSNKIPTAVAQNNIWSTQGNLPPLAPEWTNGYTDPTEC